jgi:hypothetical protein
MKQQPSEMNCSPSGLPHLPTFSGECAGYYLFFCSPCEWYSTRLALGTANSEWAYS